MTVRKGNVRTTVNFPPDIWDKIHEFRWNNRIDSLSKTIERIMRSGFEFELQNPDDDRRKNGCACQQAATKLDPMTNQA